MSCHPVWRGEFFSLWLQQCRRGEAGRSLRIGGADLFMLSDGQADVAGGLFVLHGLLFEAVRRTFGGDLMVSVADRAVRSEVAGACMPREMVELDEAWEDDGSLERKLPTGNHQGDAGAYATVCFTDPAATIGPVVEWLLERHHFVAYPRFGARPSELAGGSRSPVRRTEGLVTALLDRYRFLLIYGPRHELRIESSGDVLVDVAACLCQVEANVLALPAVRGRLARILVTDHGSYVDSERQVPMNEQIIGTLAKVLSGP